MSSLNDIAYAATPTTTARPTGMHVRDDGHHSRSIRSQAERRRKVALWVAGLLLAIAAVLAMRATGDRDERIQPGACLYDADICALYEAPLYVAPLYEAPLFEAP